MGVGSWRAGLKGERILLIGATGTLGRDLTRLLVADNRARSPADRNRITVSSRSATASSADSLGLATGDEAPTYHHVNVLSEPSVRALLASVRPTIVIDGAAHTDIGLCESNIHECVETNVRGLETTLAAVRAHIREVKCFVYMSSSNAVDPINVYGLSKALAERLIVNEHRNGLGATRHVIVRYGNQLNSSRGLMRRFWRLAHDPSAPAFPVIDRSMTRFFMTPEHSLDLTMDAAAYGRDGEIWSPNAPALSIGAVADYFATRFKKPCAAAPWRQGEKLHEVLLNQTENDQARPVAGGHYLVFHPDASTSRGREAFSSRDHVASPSLTQSILDTTLASFS